MNESGLDKKTIESTNRKQGISTKNLVTMAMFTAILCISAYISIPTPFPGSPHITMQNLMVLLIALLFPLKQSVMIVGVWMAVGLIGIPVYVAGLSGIGYLLSPWGGYTMAFMVAAVLLPMIRNKKYNRISYTITAIIGVLLINLLGMLWLKYAGLKGYNSWKAVLLGGFLTFLPMDVIKAVLVAQMIPTLRRIMPDGTGSL